MTMLSFKEYSKRKDIFYEMADRRERYGTKVMVRCGCSNKFKMRNDTPVCKECGTIIDRDMAVTLEIDRYKMYNSSTCMFVDKNEEGELIATISMMMLTVTRFSKSYYPNIGENAVRLKVRFNLTTKTGLLYMNRFRVKDDLYWNSIKTNVPYINFTQPGQKYLSDDIDIKLPKNLIKDLLKLMNISEESVRKDLSDISIYELAWLNRVRDFKEANRQRNIFETLTDRTITAKMCEDEEEFNYYRKNLNRVKRHLASGYKPKNYDENIFDALCTAYNVDRKYIPKSLEKHYYTNPAAIVTAQYHHLLFTNKDIRVNAIMRIDDSHSRTVHVSNEDIFREEIIREFKSEINVYQKIKDNSEYRYLYDTARVIRKVRDSGAKVKTKGNLRDLHDKTSKMLRYIETPDVIFENTKDLKDEIYGDYTFIYAKTPKELIYLGDISNTCVGSYYNDCISGYDKIVYIEKDENLVGILELNDRRYRRMTLSQAKGINNSLLPAKVQRVISDYCLMHGYLIHTHDIRDSLKAEHNENVKPIRKLMPELSESMPKVSLGFDGPALRFIEHPVGEEGYLPF